MAKHLSLVSLDPASRQVRLSCVCGWWRLMEPPTRVPDLGDVWSGHLDEAIDAVLAGAQGHY
jgi:hypothetical protein